jgi:hypothetical protein
LADSMLWSILREGWKGAWSRSVLSVLECLQSPGVSFFCTFLYVKLAEVPFGLGADELKYRIPRVGKGVKKRKHMSYGPAS